MSESTARRRVGAWIRAVFRCEIAPGSRPLPRAYLALPPTRPAAGPISLHVARAHRHSRWMVTGEGRVREADAELKGGGEALPGKQSMSRGNGGVNCFQRRYARVLCLVGVRVLRCDSLVWLFCCIVSRHRRSRSPLLRSSPSLVCLSPLPLPRRGGLVSLRWLRIFRFSPLRLCCLSASLCCLSWNASSSSLLRPRLARCGTNQTNSPPSDPTCAGRSAVLVNYPATWRGPRG